MDNKELTVVCITVLVCIGIVCGTLVYIHYDNNQDIESNNTTLNNSDNTTINNTTYNNTSYNTINTDNSSSSIDRSDAFSDWDAEANGSSYNHNPSPKEYNDSFTPDYTDAQVIQEKNSYRSSECDKIGSNGWDPLLHEVTSSDYYNPNNRIKRYDNGLYRIVDHQGNIIHEGWMDQEDSSKWADYNK